MSDNLSLSSKKTSSQLSNGSPNPFSDSTNRDRKHEREIYKPPEVAKREEANILRAKILVAIIIVLAVTGVGTSTYLLIKDQEKTSFENQFAGYASEIITVSRQKANQFFSALEAFTASISSQAASEQALLNTNWPFYAIPDWSIKAERLAKLTGVSDPEVAFAVIVQDDEYAGFNEFATQAVPKWYQESIRNEKPGITAKELWNKTVPFVHFLDPENNYQPTPLTGPELSVPLLQYYPLQLRSFSIAATMYNTMAAPGTATLFNITRATRKPTIGFTSIRASDGTRVVGSQIMLPIFDTPYTDAEERKHVASTGIRLHWLDYFKNILTEGEFGIIVVLKTACPDLCNREDGMTAHIASYRIDGSSAEYLGDSDMHNPKFTSMEITDIFVDLGIDESQLPEGATCVPTLSLHVYPSEDLEMSFQTNDAVVYTVVVAFIFIFTSLVFLLYDYFVRRRQTKVMERIMRQDKIVSNVFPTAIRNRLYKDQEKQKGKNVKNLDHNLDEFDDLDFDGDSTIPGSAPLADLFPSITVVFADIAGFTAWSSAREPQQVFVLLETLYGAFDKLAYRHSVFKVETVGDCYVAAVGLPEPVEKHAWPSHRRCVARGTESLPTLWRYHEYGFSNGTKWRTKSHSAISSHC
eukprot:scaffold8302_cov91-Cylindrotheca_fusiformis.AAC.2